MNNNDVANLTLLFVLTIGFIGLVIYYFSQGGSNTSCYNCGKQLRFGEHKDFSIEDSKGNRQNICSTCYKRLERKSHKGKYW